MPDKDKGIRINLQQSDSQRQIDALERLTQQLLGRVRDLSEAATQSGGTFSAADERPPHY